MRSRVLAVAALAVVLPLGVASCADTNVSKSDVAAKLKTDPRFSVLTDSQRNCIADLMMSKGNKGDLKQWVDGKKKLDDIRGDTTDITSQAMKCTGG